MFGGEVEPERLTPPNKFEGATRLKTRNQGVALVGRSMHRIVEAARETGYLTGVQPFLSDKEVDYLPRVDGLVGPGVGGRGLIHRLDDDEDRKTVRGPARDVVRLVHRRG